MFPDNISQNIDILVVINIWKNDFGFHSNQKTQGQKHQVNNLYFKYQVYQMKLRHLITFLQFRLLFHEPHCMKKGIGATRESSPTNNTAHSRLTGKNRASWKQWMGRTKERSNTTFAWEKASTSKNSTLDRGTDSTKIGAVIWKQRHGYPFSTNDCIILAIVEGQGGGLLHFLCFSLFTCPLFVSLFCSWCSICIFPSSHSRPEWCLTQIGRNIGLSFT